MSTYAAILVLRTTNLKTKNNKNCQKIELYVSLTTKELKKKHSSKKRYGPKERKDHTSRKNTTK